MTPTDEWTVATLRHLVEVMLAERDKRYEQRFQEQERALSKADEAIRSKFAGVNELRGALDDAATRLMPRAESNARYDSLVTRFDEHTKRLDVMQHRLDLREGESTGSAGTVANSLAVWAAVIAIAAVLVQALVFYLHK